MSYGTSHGERTNRHGQDKEASEDDPATLPRRRDAANIIARHDAADIIG